MTTVETITGHLGATFNEFVYSKTMSQTLLLKKWENRIDGMAAVNVYLAFLFV